MGLDTYIFRSIDPGFDDLIQKVPPKSLLFHAVLEGAWKSPGNLLQLLMLWRNNLDMRTWAENQFELIDQQPMPNEMPDDYNNLWLEMDADRIEAFIASFKDGSIKHGKWIASNDSVAGRNIDLFNSEIEALCGVTTGLHKIYYYHAW